MLGPFGQWESVEGKLAGCRSKLTNWQRNRKDPGGRMQWLKDRIMYLNGTEGQAACEEGKLLKKELQLLLDQEDIRWRQRRRRNGLEMGTVTHGISMSVPM